jgi:hypothetical protein
MNANVAAAELAVHYAEGRENLEKEVCQTVVNSFGTILDCAGRFGPRKMPPVSNPREVADEIAKIILSFSRIARAPAACEKAIEGIRDRICGFVHRNMPVEGQMLLSPKKHWVYGAQSAVDLAELASLQTLVSIHLAVCNVYPAGMTFVLTMEDIDFEFVELQNPQSAETQELYISGMKRLIGALGRDDLFVVRRVSECATSSDELGRWRNQIAENYRALKVYWQESEKCAGNSAETLPSFKQLAHLGWRGTIPLEMRQHYLKRLGQLAGSSEQEKVDIVLRNFAAILLHYQVRLLRGSGPLDPIKFSFVRSAHTAPEELLQGRVDLRFAPRKLCSRVSAAGPGATKAFVSARGNRLRVSFRGWHELARLRHQFSEGWLTIKGCGGEAMVRTDFLPES